MSLKKDNELLLLTTAQIKTFSELIDSAFDAETSFKNGIVGKIAEAVDGPFVKISLTQINKLASPYIDDNYKDEIQTAIDDCLDGDADYSLAIEQAFSVFEQVKDKLDVQTWAKTMIESLLSLAKTGLLIFMENKIKNTSE